MSGHRLLPRKSMLLFSYSYYFIIIINQLFLNYYLHNVIM